jgi:hypothetical protein
MLITIGSGLWRTPAASDFSFLSETATMTYPRLYRLSTNMGIFGFASTKYKRTGYYNI